MRALLFAVSLLTVSGAFASSGHHLKEVSWPFDGIFGTFDRQAAQRGYQVYKEVCASCHSMSLKSFRNLQEIGFSEAEVKSIAASYTVKDGPNDAGEMFDRPGRPSDHFVSPFPNEKAARAANNGAYPPDQSLLIKARHDGANYVYSLLTGYDEAKPADLQLGAGMSYNPYFPGMQIGMSKPLQDGQITYADGTKATVDQMSRDVVVFLQWAAEPEMEHRKQMGIKVLLFLFVMTGLLYVAKKRIWSQIK
jgi:ubiquinol-cytochrome c reductase cytochrome c1 subunit